MKQDETKLRDDAISFAKRNKKQIAKRVADPAIYPPERDPVSVFMAGSPGAGKTEASIALIDELRDESPVLRIDPDELRCELPGYRGDNSWLFHGAVSILVDRIHDSASKNHQSFILDGTLSRYEIAEKNIERSLRRERYVQLLYVYQDPVLAWVFVQAREVAEGRRIPKNQFINQYFAARDVVNTFRVADMKDLFSSTKPTRTTRFSEFIRDARSRDKKRVFIPDRGRRRTLRPTHR